MFADKGLHRNCPDTIHIWIYLYLKLFKETTMLNKIKVTININLVAFTLSQPQFILCLELTEFKTSNLGLTTTKYLLYRYSLPRYLSNEYHTHLFTDKFQHISQGSNRRLRQQNFLFRVSSTFHSVTSYTHRPPPLF